MSRQASGLKAWVVQRVTAVYLALFAPYLLLHLIVSPPADHAAWRAWVAQPWVSLGLLLLVPVLLAHAWVGLRDILMDYVKPLVWRAGLLSLAALAWLACGLWALRSLLLVGLQG